MSLWIGVSIGETTNRTSLMHYTVKHPARIETRQKDSKFIAHLAHADTREDAERYLKSIAQRYADATHHCMAYRLGEGDRLVYRCDDAGEPAGSAGPPILQALENRQVSDAVLVVVRYFGGTKLGIGGLIRAYSGAAYAVIDAAALAPVQARIEISLVFDFDQLGNIHQLAHRFGVEVQETTYTEKVRMRVVLPAQDRDSFVVALTDATRGKIVFHE